jgi:hypothetical protein
VNHFLVGTAHGGLLLTLKKGVVTEMFLGAMAFRRRIVRDNALLSRLRPK